MSQVIEVRLISEVDGEKLTDQITLATSHQEAVELALHYWSGGRAVMKGMNESEGFEQGKWDHRGSCFVYKYQVNLEGRDEKPGVPSDWGVIAVLFAQYKEKKSA